MGQAEGIGRLLAAIALQNPERAQQCAQAAADLAPGQAAFEGGVVGIHELATDGGEEMEVAHQIDGWRLPTGSNGLGRGAAQVAHEGHRMAESVQGGLDGGV